MSAQVEQNLRGMDKISMHSGIDHSTLGVGEMGPEHPISPVSGRYFSQTATKRPLCPRYAASISDTASEYSDDSTQDSLLSYVSTSSASSVDGDNEQLFPHNSTDLECKNHASKKKIKEEDLSIGDNGHYSPSLFPSAKDTSKTTSKDSSIGELARQLEALLKPKKQDINDIAKAAAKEPLVVFTASRARSMAVPKENVNILTWQAGMVMHGDSQGKQAGSFNGLDGNNGAMGPPIYPDHVKPPNEWGSSGKQQGDGNDDGGVEEGGWNRGGRGPRAKKRIACPAAKGDPFNNRACLGVSFPNLAKTRQHLSCAAHFAVEKTPLLPDQIRDPHGWDHIMSYIYPGKEISSSDEDFHATMDIIQRRGEGPGRPDFRNTLIRLLKYSLQNPNYGEAVIREFEAIDPSPPSPSPPEDYVMVESQPFYPPSEMESYHTGFDTSNSSTFFQHAEQNFNGLANSQRSPNTSASVSMGAINTPTSATSSIAPEILPGYRTDFLNTDNFGFPPGLNLMTFMDNNHGSRAVPDPRNQTDGELRTSPSPDQHPRIYIQTTDSRLLCFKDEIGIFESWIERFIPGFSFMNYSLLELSGSTYINNFQDLYSLYDNFQHTFADPVIHLQVIPKLGSSNFLGFNEQ